MKKTILAMVLTLSAVMATNITCDEGFSKYTHSVWTLGKSDSKKLETTLYITPLLDDETFVINKVLTYDTSSINQSHEQFKIVSIGDYGKVDETSYTIDLDNNLEDIFSISDLGKLDVQGAKRLLLVHKASPKYGDIITNEANSVDFKSLCYKRIKLPKGAIPISTYAETDANGCSIITTFTDNNGDLMYDNTEIISVTDPVCNGENGTDGTDGTNGDNGIDGLNGTDGIDGNTTIITQPCNVCNKSKCSCKVKSDSGGVADSGLALGLLAFLFTLIAVSRIGGKEDENRNEI